jgi:hypothetical protein
MGGRSSKHGLVTHLTWPITIRDIIGAVLPKHIISNVSVPLTYHDSQGPVSLPFDRIASVYERKECGNCATNQPTNQPTKGLTKGEDMHEIQRGVPWSV